MSEGVEALLDANSLTAFAERGGRVVIVTREAGSNWDQGVFAVFAQLSGTIVSIGNKLSSALTLDRLLIQLGALDDADDPTHDLIAALLQRAIPTQRLILVVEDAHTLDARARGVLARLPAAFEQNGRLMLLVLSGLPTLRSALSEFAPLWGPERTRHVDLTNGPATDTRNSPALPAADTRPRVGGGRPALLAGAALMSLGLAWYAARPRSTQEGAANATAASEQAVATLAGPERPTSPPDPLAAPPSDATAAEPAPSSPPSPPADATSNPLDRPAEAGSTPPAPPADVSSSQAAPAASERDLYAAFNHFLDQAGPDAQALTPRQRARLFDEYRVWRARTGDNER